MTVDTARANDAIVIRLSSMDELFAPEAFDPWTGAGAREAGIRRLLDAVRAAPTSAATRATILVPPDPTAADATAADAPERTAADRTAAAVQRWCDAEIEARDRELAVLRRRDRVAFLVGAGWLVACLTLAGVVESSGTLPDVLRLVLGEGLVIAGWVGMWKPLDILLYDRVDARREQRALRTLRAMPLTIHDG